MAFWDFLGTTGNTGLGGMDAVSALMGVQPNAQQQTQQLQSDFLNREGMWSKAKNALFNSNSYATYGQFAQGLDQGMGIGGAAGMAGYNNVRRKVMQEAGGQVGQNQQAPLQQLIKAIIEDDPRKLVGPEDDSETANSMKINKDGTVQLTLAAPPAAKKDIVQGEEPSLESIKKMGEPGTWYKHNSGGDSPF